MTPPADEPTRHQAAGHTDDRQPWYVQIDPEEIAEDPAAYVERIRREATERAAAERAADPYRNTEEYRTLLEWGQRIVPCNCGDAYTDRGLVAPDCLWHEGAEVVLDELLDSRWMEAFRVRLLEPAEAEIARLRAQAERGEALATRWDRQHAGGQTGLDGTFWPDPAAGELRAAMAKTAAER